VVHLALSKRIVVGSMLHDVNDVICITVIAHHRALTAIQRSAVSSENHKLSMQCIMQ